MNIKTEKAETSSLLLPAFQKLYSALSNLEKFKKNNDFFDNISYLDNFFSELRAVSFVLEKTLAHTEFLEVYKLNTAKFFNTPLSKWFNDKRVEVQHKNPFILEKRIVFTVYLPAQSYKITEMSFTVEDDIPLSTLENRIKAFLKNFDDAEIFFSTEYSFFEKGKDKELYEDIVEGVKNMKKFLSAMQSEIKDNSKVLIALNQKIERLMFTNSPKDMLFAEDYVYYSDGNTFEKAARVAMFLGSNSRIKVSELGWNKEFPKGTDIFGQFIIMHIVIYQEQKTLMPTFMVFYNDETFEIISFHSSIKTTIYRKINDIAKLIDSGDVISVFYVGEMLSMPYQTDKELIEFLEMTAPQRAKLATHEILSFFKVDNKLERKAISFSTKSIDSMEYVRSVLNNESNHNAKEDKEILFLLPLVKAFENRKRTSK